MQITVSPSNLGLPSTNTPLEEGWYQARISAAVDEQGKDNKGPSCKLTIDFLTPEKKIVQKLFWYNYDHSQMKDFPRKIVNAFNQFVGGVPPHAITQGGFSIDPTTWLNKSFYCYYRPGEQTVDAEGKTKYGPDTKIPCSVEDYQRNVSAAAAGTGFAAPTGVQQVAPQQVAGGFPQQVAGGFPQQVAPQQVAGGFPAAGAPSNGGFPAAGAPAAGFGFPGGFPNMNAGR